MRGGIIVCFNVPYFSQAMKIAIIFGIVSSLCLVNASGKSPYVGTMYGARVDIITCANQNVCIAVYRSFGLRHSIPQQWKNYITLACVRGSVRFLYERFLLLAGCPPGQDPVQCLIAPCTFAHCDNYPTAVCVDDYCGGCNARFFVGKIEVTSLCGPGRPIKSNEC